MVVCALAIAYGVWANRERSRAYFGLMLFLTGSIVGVFASQDLLLFYAFFEAMLIPIYVLVGVWGGPRRVAATLTFVIYTMAGSMLMLASIVAFGISQHTFSLVDSGISGNNWIFLGFAVAFAVKAPLLPFHGWLRMAYTEAPPEVAAILSGVVSKAAVFGFIRIALPKFPGPVEHFRSTILVLAALGLVYGSLLAFRQPDIRSVIAYSSLGQMSLIVLGHLRRQPDRPRRSCAALGQPRARLGRDVPARRHRRAGLRNRRVRQAGRSGARKADPRLGADDGGACSRSPSQARPTSPESSSSSPASSAGLGLCRRRRGRDGARGDVHAARDLRVLHERRGEAVPEQAPDLRFDQLVIVVPLVACLLALSVWPNAVSGHSFPAGAAPAAAGRRRDRSLDRDAARRLARALARACAARRLGRRAARRRARARLVPPRVLGADRGSRLRHRGRARSVSSTTAARTPVALIADSMTRDRWAALAQILIAGAGASPCSSPGAPSAVTTSASTTRCSPPRAAGWSSSSRPRT